MKKLTLLLIMGVLVLCLCTNVVFASDCFEILKYSMPEGNREGVRLSEVFENMGAKVTISNSGKTYKVVKGDVEIILNSNSKTAVVNGVSNTLEFATKVYSNVAYIPYSFAQKKAGLFGYKITWDSANKKVVGSKIVKSISFSSNNINITEGSKDTIELTAVYADGTNGDIVSKAKYSGTNNKVATAVKEGKTLVISARNIGTTKLTASYEGFTTDITINTVRDAELYGNWLGNIANRSRIISNKESTIYYANPNDGNRLYMADIGLTKMRKINDDKPNYISYLGGWLYYSNQGDNHKIYKVSADGSERIKITDEGAYYLNVVDDWIYYQNISDSNKIYRIRTNGKQKQKLSDDNSTGLNVCYGWIFYINNDDGKKIYKIRTDGTGRQRVNSFATQNLSIYDKWIYHSNTAEKGYLYKISIEGKDRKRLTQVAVSSINVCNGWVYYTNKDNDNKLYKVKIDGTENMKVCDESVTSISVLDDSMYINSLTSNKNKIYRFKINTPPTEPVKLEEFTR